MPNIADIPDMMAALPSVDRQRIELLFDINSSVGHLRPPAEMIPWIERQFGSVDAVAKQRVLRITNRWTFEGTLFNPLRARRPVPETTGQGIQAEIEATRGDPFCAPEAGTPADVFGRIRGRASVTAANVAKYEGWCSVIVFDEHDPLRLTRQGVDDAIQTGFAWANKVRTQDPEARYFFFMWNCLWRAGSSVVHGHAQVASTRGSHFGHVERWRAAARRYGRGYFEDLYRAHSSFGLAFELDGVRVLAHLTPLKEKEILLIAPKVTPAFRKAIYTAVATFIGDLGVTSFNLGMYHRPLGRPTWRNFPVIVRLIDRGDPSSRNSDFGAMELFASSIVASDPYDVLAALRTRFGA